MEENGNISEEKTDNFKKESCKKLSVFLGAGASAAGGYRTFLTFPHMFWPTSIEPAILHATDKERVLLSSIRRELERKRKPLTLDYYLSVLNSYNIVLQSIFSDEELRSRFSDSLLLWSRMQELNNLVQRSRKHICDLTTSHYKRVPNKEYFYHTMIFYKRLFQEFKQIEVFTTNYDIVPEYLFSGNDWFISKCASSWNTKIEDIVTSREVNFYNGIKDFRNLSFTGDIEAQAESFRWGRSHYDTPMKPCLVVFRLHGCVAWFYTRQLKGSKPYFDIRDVD